MEITYSLDDFTVKVNLCGELDHHTAKNTIMELDRIIDLYIPHELILDLRGVTFMDSSGIAVLVGAYRKQNSGDCTLKVINTMPQPTKLLKAAGLTRFIHIEQTVKKENTYENY